MQSPVDAMVKIHVKHRKGEFLTIQLDSPFELLETIKLLHAVAGNELGKLQPDVKDPKAIIIKNDSGER